MEGIIVGIDGSIYATEALRWAVDQGEQLGRPVTAVMAWGYMDQHHLEPEVRFEPGYSSDVAAKVLAELVTSALGEGHDVECRAICDLPARALLDASGGADLLVVGARGMGGFKGLLLGSVSRKILCHAACPVAVVRDDERGIDRHAPVVVGIDGSGPAQRALAWAVDHARATDRPLHVLNAWQLPYTFAGIMTLARPAEFPTVSERFIQEQLDRVDTTGVIVKARPVVGRASAALLEASCGAAVTVVGSRGHSPLAATVLGSVSEQVSHHALSPVVVVP